jgi:monoterpene epsilon-lactone hydrolase
MPIPTPEPGLVISYAYLWRYEHDVGQEEGRKDRPSVIVLAIEREADGTTIVTVLPITHSPPADPAGAVEIPAAVKRHLRFDDDRSWIIVSEGNEFDWPGYDLRKIGTGDRYDYGFLPPRQRTADSSRRVRQAICILGSAADHGQPQPCGPWPEPARAGILRPPPHRERPMAQSEIDAIRGLLKTKARPVGWEERRKRIEEVCAVWPVAGDVELETVDVDGLKGEWSIVPGSDSSRVLLFFHGGGYCSGSIVSHRRMVTEAGRAAASRTLAVEYRLAPEHPFPAAYDDALKAWAFLRGQGFSTGQIAIGGDSAGAGLTAALIARLRAETGEAPASAWLVSPWTDLTMSEETMKTKDAVDPLIHEGYLEELAAAYAPAGIDKKDPRVSPLYADLHDFPPTLIQVGSAETLLDDATRFAAAAGAADVAVTLEVWPRMIHAFPIWNAHLEPARRALMHAGEFMRRFW